jgi:formate dehydrogenase major subunit
LAEAQPDMFIELSEELAQEKGIGNGEKVKIRSARGEIAAVAIVTKRFKPFTINGKLVHEIGMPWHFGWGGGHEAPALAKGDTANDLTPHIGDANTMIPEYKAFLVDVQKA